VLVHAAACASGTLPESLADFQSLIVFNAANNYLRGPIPPGLLRGHASLRDVGLNYNLLTGDIPAAISPSIGNLNLHHNALNGTFPANLCSVPCSLNTLRVNDNFLHGKLPEQFENYSALNSLDISRNLMTGTLPGGLQVMEKLGTLSLSGNMLSGPLTHVLSLERLTTLEADSNWFTGPLTFPPLMSLGVQSMNVSHNLFSGPFTIEFSGSSSQMSTLDASHNHLTGPIPANLNQVYLFEFYFYPIDITNCHIHTSQHNLLLVLCSSLIVRVRT
jgi:hypothetical protein